MHPPKYVWITVGWYIRQWWTHIIGNTSCPTMIIERMLNHSLTFSPNGNLVSDDKDIATFSGLVCNCVGVTIVLCMDMYYKEAGKKYKMFFLTFKFKLSVYMHRDGGIDALADKAHK